MFSVLAVLLAVACDDASAVEDPPPETLAAEPSATAMDPVPTRPASMRGDEPPPDIEITDDGTPLVEGTPDFEDETCDEWARLACECNETQCRMVRAHHNAVRLAKQGNDVRQHGQLRRVCEQMVEHFSCE